MEQPFPDLTLAAETSPPTGKHQPVNGSYSGQFGSLRLDLRVDIEEGNADSPYRPLNLISGDLFRDVGGGEWDYRSSFVVEHPYLRWGDADVTLAGTMTVSGSGLPASASPELSGQPALRLILPLHQDASDKPPAPAEVQITRWGSSRLTFQCAKESHFFRAVDLEIDRIEGTELPRPYQTHSLEVRPADLPSLELDIPRAYQRAGIDMRVISDGEVLPLLGAGTDEQWDEDELHNAMEHHFSLWRDQPQWKLYLLLATHYKLYPARIVTGIMYDSQYRDPNDPCPRQGAAAFHSSMVSAWDSLVPAEFDRDYLRTCVHELGHALNLIHSFDRDQPDSPSWMNYPWRYPYGYNLPPSWNGTGDYWHACRFEFDDEELRHLRHDPLLDVIPGGAALGASTADAGVPWAESARQQEAAPVALYLRTRPERYLFEFAEPVTVEVKLQNQTAAPMVVPDMLSAEFGLLELFLRDPRGQVRPYKPLFKLCGQARNVELPAGEKLFESIFLGYGADGFYFEEPGEYQVWAAYGAGGLRLRSNVLRIRVAFPLTADDEKVALYTFGRDQGHVLYMRGAEHLQSGVDQLREVADRYPTTYLARYIQMCLGSSQARDFKNLVTGQVRPPQPEAAIGHLSEAAKFLRRTGRSALDNITHNQTVQLLAKLYDRMDEPEKAKALLDKTVRYFTRMEVKPEVIATLRSRARLIS